MLFLTITKEQKCGKEFQLKIASCVLRPSRLTLGKRKRRIPYLSLVARPTGGYPGFHIMMQDRSTPSQSQPPPPPSTSSDFLNNLLLLIYTPGWRNAL